VAPQENFEGSFNYVAKFDFIRWFNWYQNKLPINLGLALSRAITKPPKDTCLTYACNHLVFRDEPWVVDLEYLSILIGINTIGNIYKKILLERLGSKNCKKIMCWTECARQSVIQNLPYENIANKTSVVPLCVRSKKFVKKFSNDKIKLLFVGSINIPGEFVGKGGREVLEAFNVLNQKYKNVEIVIRSDTPANIKRKFSRFSNVRILDAPMPWAMLEQEFQSSDIFLLPAYITPGMVILDAMSYELPVITTDVWANPEIVNDGVTGFLVKKSECVKWYTGKYIPSGWYTPEFRKGMEKTDPAVIKQIVDHTSILIEDEQLRRRMGSMGRYRIEHGDFSIERRNSKLQKIFDEATK
jgi:glycosyltransferase involved in cell wall biosynthesis